MEKKLATPVKKVSVKKTVKPVVSKVSEKGKYIEAVGRRKTSVARVRIYPDASSRKTEVVVNDRPFEKFFSVEKQQHIVLAPFTVTGESVSMTVLVKGGGVNSQAEAVRMGLARALILMTPAYRGKLKSLDFLKRDPRMVERKKFGSRKARRPQQWRKR